MPVPRTELLLTWAGWAGAHALTVFFALLGLSLAAAAALWRAGGRGSDRPARTGLLIARAALGFAFVAAAATLFAEIAEHLRPTGELARIDDALTAALRRHVDRPTLRSFAVLTQLGDESTLKLLAVAVAALLWWRRRRTLAIGWLLALGGNALLNPLLKRIFARVRPLHEHGLVSADGYGFPSGHSSGATVAYGMLAYIALHTLPPRWHLPALLAAVAVVVTVGSSRVFLQVHFASDVAAGFASGAVWLAICVAGVQSSWLWRSRRQRGIG